MQGPSDFPVLECLYCFGLELFWEFYHCDAGGEHTVLCVFPQFFKNGLRAVLQMPQP